MAELLEPVARELLQGPAGLHSTRAMTREALDQVLALRAGGGRAYAAAWEQHESQLLEFARRENVKPPGDSRHYFGQSRSLGLLRKAFPGGTLLQQQQRDRAPVANASVAIPPPPSTRTRFRIPVARGDDRRVTLHEAGHAVIGVSRGWTVEFVELRTRVPSYSLGRVQFDDSPDEPDVWGLVVALCAGAAAEARAFGGVVEFDASDARQARVVIGQMLHLLPSHPDVDARLAVAQAEAAADVRQHWPWILATADALQAHRRLSDAHVRALQPKGKD